jgi:hypothetical protein
MNEGFFPRDLLPAFFARDHSYLAPRIVDDRVHVIVFPEPDERVLQAMHGARVTRQVYRSESRQEYRMTVNARS